MMNKSAFALGFALCFVLLSWAAKTGPVEATDAVTREANVSVRYDEPIEDKAFSECLFPCEVEPQEPGWEPDPADVAYISRTIWGEVRGCTVQEQEATAWCILNRVDDQRFPDTIQGVVTAKYQWQGYSASNPVDAFADMARDILIRWHNGEHGIPAGMCWCSGDGKHQTFRDEWIETVNTHYWPEK